MITLDDETREDATNSRAVPLIEDGFAGTIAGERPCEPCEREFSVSRHAAETSGVAGSTADDSGFAHRPDGVFDGIPVRGGIQGVLFEFDDEPQWGKGYRGTVAKEAAGITYRQLDYWARRGIVSPSVEPSHGSGSCRLYSFTDIVLLAVAKHLLDVGVNLTNVSIAVAYLAQLPVDELHEVTVLSDGRQIYECTSDEQIVSLLHRGRALFGVSVGPLWEQVRCLIDAVDVADAALNRVTARVD